MAVSLHELLQPQVILRVVSRVRSGQNRLASWLGFQPRTYDPETTSLNGPNTVQGDTRYVTFRLFDFTRMAAWMRAPGTGPATVAPNPVGDVKLDCARAHIKIPLSYEELGNLSPIIGPNSNIDQGGQDYVTRMISHIARRFNQLIELMTTGMIQDNLWVQYQGDNWVPYIGQPAGALSFQVSYNIPAGNKAQLNMLGAGNIIGTSWNNVAAPIIGNIHSIRAAFQQLTNFVMSDIWVNSITWYNILVNTEVRNLAGSANVPFAEFDRTPPSGYADGSPNEAWSGVLRGVPGVRWHITDEVVGTGADIDPSYAVAPAAAVLLKTIPDKFAIFMPEPSSDWTQMYLGGEYVVENPGMPGALRRGYYFWREYTTQPSAIDLIGLMNAVPVLYVTKAIAPAQVIFP